MVLWLSSFWNHKSPSKMEEWILSLIGCKSDWNFTTLLKILVNIVSWSHGLSTWFILTPHISSVVHRLVRPPSSVRIFSDCLIVCKLKWRIQIQNVLCQFCPGSQSSLSRGYPFSPRVFPAYNHLDTINQAKRTQTRYLGLFHRKNNFKFLMVLLVCRTGISLCTRVNSIPLGLL